MKIRPIRPSSYPKTFNSLLKFKIASATFNFNNTMNKYLSLIHKTILKVDPIFRAPKTSKGKLAQKRLSKIKE